MLGRRALTLYFVLGLIWFVLEGWGVYSCCVSSVWVGGWFVVGSLDFWGPVLFVFRIIFFFPVILQSNYGMGEILYGRFRATFFDVVGMTPLTSSSYRSLILTMRNNLNLLRQRARVGGGIDRVPARQRGHTSLVTHTSFLLPWIHNTPCAILRASAFRKLLHHHASPAKTQIMEP